MFKVHRLTSSMMLLAAPGLLLVGALAHAAPATTPNIEIVLSIHKDGSIPFSAPDPSVIHTDCTTSTSHPLAHTPGDDGDGANCGSDQNGIVRTFDVVTYRVDWNVNEVDATGVQWSATLPVTLPEAEWVEIPPGCDTTLSTLNSTTRELTCVLGDFHEGTSGTIFPLVRINGTRSDIDGNVLTFDVTGDSNETGLVSSDDVSVTISAAPRYNWAKGLPKMYGNVANEAGVDGWVASFPIYLKPGGTGAFGSAPMDDTVPISFHDHLYWLSSNGDAVLDATLITAGNIATYTGAFGANGNRACGGYTGDGSEDYWDAGLALPKPINVPFGEAGYGTVNDTTAGALAGSEVITCTDVTGTNGYPIVKIDISGHDTLTQPPKAANGKGNPSIGIAAQISFWMPASEVYPDGAATNTYIHNAIRNSTSPVPPPLTADDTTPAGDDDIPVPGSSDGLETTPNDNYVPANITQTPTSGGPGERFSHWIKFHKGPYKQVQIFDPDTGMYLADIDDRTVAQGGLGRNGVHNTEATNPRDRQWNFLGEVSRNQTLTIESGFQTNRNPDVAPRNEAIHGCVYVDNKFLDIVDFPTSFPVSDTLAHRENTESATVSSSIGNPSHGLVHVMYGDHGRSWVVNDIWHTGVRLNPSFTPDYVVEVATANTDVGTAYDRSAVTCNDADAAGGVWTPITSLADAAAYDPDGDGRYDGIELIRVRTLEPVPWTAPFNALIRAVNNQKTAQSVGAGFRLFIQTRVKPTVPLAPNGSKIFVHASRAYGEFDGVDTPPTGLCRSQLGTGVDEFSQAQDGWCNLGTDPFAVTSPDNSSDPYERIYQGPNNINLKQLSHRDTVTVVGPSLGISKTNSAGNSHIVRNGDLVTYNINVSVTGAPVIDDMLTNIAITDALSANYDFVSMTQPTDGACTGGANISCTFGDRIAPWSDSFSITVRVKNGLADQALPNTANVTAQRAGDGSNVSAASTAFAYMPPPYHVLDIEKEVPDLNGECVHAPGLSHYGAASDDCSWIDIGDQLVYELTFENFGNALLDNFRVIDVLPHLADENEAQSGFQGTPAAPAGTHGDGRQPETDFSGTTELASVVSSLGGTIYYTVAPPATIVRDPDHPSNATGFPNGATQWCSTFGGAGCPASIDQATAFYVEVGTLGVGGVESITVTIDTDSNLEDDIYTNTFGARTDDIFVPNRSNDVSIMVEQYDLAVIKTLAAGQFAGVNLGDTVDYVITVENQGTVDSGEYSITDMIPAGMSFVSATPAPDGAPAAGATGLQTWTFPATGGIVAGGQQNNTITPPRAAATGRPGQAARRGPRPRGGPSPASPASKSSR